MKTSRALGPRAYPTLYPPHLLLLPKVQAYWNEYKVNGKESTNCNCIIIIFWLNSSTFETPGGCVWCNKWEPHITSSPGLEIWLVLAHLKRRLKMSEMSELTYKQTISVHGKCLFQYHRVDTIKYLKPNSSGPTKKN